MAAAASDKSGGSGDAAREAALSERKTAVTAAIRSGNSLLAVRTALDSPPFGTKNKDLKVSSQLAPAQWDARAPPPARGSEGQVALGSLCSRPAPQVACLQRYKPHPARPDCRALADDEL